MNFDDDVDHNRLAEAAANALSPAMAAAVGECLEAGKAKEAFALANIQVAFDIDRPPRSLPASEREAMYFRTKEIDPRLLLLHFPRRSSSPREFLPRAIYLFRAPLAQATASPRETALEGPADLWIRARPAHDDATQLVLERVAADARLESERWESVPWRYSKRFESTDAYIQDGAALDFDWLRRRQFDETLAPPDPSDPDNAATLALALLDEDRVEEALVACGVGLTPSAEALLYGDVHAVFERRLRSLFKRADDEALKEDAARLARPRTSVTTTARRFLRQSSPWTFRSAAASLPMEWRGAPEEAVYFCPLDAHLGPEGVWMGLNSEHQLDVFVAPKVDHVVAAPQLLRSLLLEWRRYGLWPQLR